MDFTLNWGHIITIALFVIGGWVAVRNSMQGQLNDIKMSVVKLETMMADLKDDVQKHNNVVEKTAIMQRDMKTAWMRHDELRERVHDLEQKVS